MFKVTVQITEPHLLAARMSAMRQWLDAERIEPMLFDCTTDADDVAVCWLTFRQREHATAFALAFGGAVSGSAAA